MHRFLTLAVLKTAPSLFLAWIASGYLLASAAGAASNHAANMHAVSPAPASTTMTMPMPSGQVMLPPEDPNVPVSPVNATQWSEFNHRGSGLFVLFWGLTALLAGLQYPARTWLRFVPPLALLGLAEFLFVRNDPKAWPIGPYGFWISFQDPGVFEHRIFLVIILALFVVEMLRAADRLPPFLRRFALPIIVLVASVLLFFHKHGGLAMQEMMQHASDPSMSSNPAMSAMLASMNTVKHEHAWFAIFGLGLGATRLLADLGVLKGRLGATLWTLFAIALGIYMVGYVE